MKIRFLVDYTVKDGSGDAYAKGDVRDFTPESAQHFIRRRAAVAVAVGADSPKRDAPPKKGPSSK